MFYIKSFFIFYIFILGFSDFFKNDIYASETISIENAYIPIFYPKQTSASGYFILKNNTSKNLKIISIKSNFGNAKFHNSIIDKEGVAKMFEISSIELPAYDTLNFQPSSLHIMFSNINDYKDVKNIKVFLSFNDGSEITIPFEIVSNIKDQKKHHHSHHEKSHNH